MGSSTDPGIHQLIKTSLWVKGSMGIAQGRLDHQEFGGIGELLDQFTVFLFEGAFKVSYITGFRNTFLFQWNGFDQVVTDVHH